MAYQSPFDQASYNGKAKKKKKKKAKRKPARKKAKKVTKKRIAKKAKKKVTKKRRPSRKKSAPARGARMWSLQWVVSGGGIYGDYRPLWPVMKAEKARLEKKLKTKNVFSDETIDEVYHGGFSLFLSVERVKMSKAQALNLLKDTNKRLTAGLTKAGYEYPESQGYGASETFNWRGDPEIKTWR